MTWPEILFISGIGGILLLGAANTASVVCRDWLALGGSTRGGWVRGLAVVALSALAWLLVSGSFTWGFREAGWSGGLAMTAMSAGALLLCRTLLAWPPARKALGIKPLGGAEKAIADTPA
ncbi:MAG: hypothetical protein ACPGOV_11470 [Magnetovibrionaceae bacterium]